MLTLAEGRIPDSAGFRRLPAHISKGFPGRTTLRRAPCRVRRNGRREPSDRIKTRYVKERPERCLLRGLAPVRFVPKSIHFSCVFRSSHFSNPVKRQLWRLVLLKPG